MNKPNEKWIVKITTNQNETIVVDEFEKNEFQSANKCFYEVIDNIIKCKYYIEYNDINDRYLEKLPDGSPAGERICTLISNIKNISLILE